MRWDKSNVIKKWEKSTVSERHGDGSEVVIMDAQPGTPPISLISLRLVVPLLSTFSTEYTKH